MGHENSAEVLNMVCPHKRFAASTLYGSPDSRAHRAMTKRSKRQCPPKYGLSPSILSSDVLERGELVIRIQTPGIFTLVLILCFARVGSEFVTSHSPSTHGCDVLSSSVLSSIALDDCFGEEHASCRVNLQAVVQSFLSSSFKSFSMSNLRSS